MTTTITAKLGKKTFRIDIVDRKVSAVDASGTVYLADGMASDDGCADVVMYRHGLHPVGRLIVDKDRAYFA